MTIRIGVLGRADIAFNRFLPALMKSPSFECVGVAQRNFLHDEKTNRFIETFNLPIFHSYEDLLESPEVDAVYIPLPPALHYLWAKKALLSGKHVMLEKPFTTEYVKTLDLVTLAKERDLAIHENYMFLYHAQLKEIKRLIQSGSIGDVRLFKASFGFPMRASNDFRYNKQLGGGALLDAGGYVLSLARELLLNPEILYSELRGLPNFEVDMFGSVALRDSSTNYVFQGSWGMDNYYQCCLEVWTSLGKLTTNRIFTAPAGYTPSYIWEEQGKVVERELPEDDHFLNSIEYFGKLIECPEIREESCKKILSQSSLLQKIIDEQ